MAYKDKEKAAAKKREWEAANPEKVKAAREKENERRRQRRRDAVVRGDEAAIRRLMYREMTPEQKAALQESRKEYQRKWQKENYEASRARYKERMATDPEFAAKQRQKWQEKNAKRRGIPKDETPEQRDRRRQRQREYDAKRRREKKMMAQLVPAKPKEVTPKVAPPPPLPKPAFNPHANRKKPGRLMALAGWNRF